MKIKSWLFVSYLIVMILPLLAAYYLYVWINAYNDEIEVKDYFEKWTELQAILPVLEEPELYQVGRAYPELDSITSDKLEVNLYLKEGFQIYTSNPLKQLENMMLLNTQRLYEDLYKFEASFNSYSYKQPVFIGTDIVGFFDVKLLRSEWIKGVSNMSTYVIVAFALIFITIFSAVVYFVNRKLNKPLKRLIIQMRAFAKNEEIEPIRIKNDEIGELANSFKEMREQIDATQEQLKQEQKEKEYMIASISHDLKTPLTSIRAYAEGLTNKENIEEYSSIIIEKSQYMKQMIDDLLMYTLLQSPNYQLNKVDVDGNEFFEMLISDYELLCKEQQIKLQTICDVSGNYRSRSKPNASCDG